MYELNQVSERCYYIQSPAKIGLVRTGDTSVVLIDSGNDKDVGKKVLRLLEGKGWTLEAIYNTHSHADHIGGNRYLQDRTGCRIYAPGIEYDFTRAPILESSYLYGGNPPSELRHKFLMAQSSRVKELASEDLPACMQMIPLPGHAFDMVGYRVDNVVYLADCLSSEATLAKYRISFLVDPKKYIDTLRQVREMEANWFVPAHADATQEIRSLCDINIACVREIADHITALCTQAQTGEDILAALFAEYGLTMTMEQHALVGSTVRSYLTYLSEEGRIVPTIRDNRLMWQAQS